MKNSLCIHQHQTAETDRIIRMAWEDRTTFEEIHEAFGVDEAGVIWIMRRALKPKRFRLWRKRVSGRMTKHRTRFRAQQNLNRSPGRLEE